MNAEGIHPFVTFVNLPRKSGRLSSPWAEGGWKVFLNSPADMRRAIKYVEQNPIRAGMKRQRWSCVSPYIG
jgi:hypothetical protein